VRLNNPGHGWEHDQLLHTGSNLFQFLEGTDIGSETVDGITVGIFRAEYGCDLIIITPSSGMRGDVRKERVTHKKNFIAEQKRQGIGAVSRQMVGDH
jgi:hypothetical protein